MSNSDSFIDEVNEAVRRDALLMYARRYGWIVALIVIAIVGGASYFEWQKAQAAARAKANGSALIAAVESPENSVRLLKLQELRLEGPSENLRVILEAGVLSTEDSLAAADLLRDFIANETVEPVYRDLARLKLVQLPENPLLSQERLRLLEPLTIAGNSFRPLALELTALLHVERNETQDALGILYELAQSAEIGPAQGQRVARMIVALGGDLSEAGLN
ncbi:MAG: hypothetical protein ACPGNV_08430 [Mangrovicoccus sp.]